MTKRRLHLSRPDFSSATGDAKARRATSPHFSALYSKNGVGFAFVVSKKVAKLSVGRHLLKRRVREAAKNWCSDSYALIVYARAGSATLTYKEIEAELTPLLQRVVG
jgi:ribonuclease P protein component